MSSQVLGPLDGAIASLGSDISGVTTSALNLTTAQASALGNLLGQLQTQLTNLQNLLNKLSSGNITGAQLVSGLQTILGNLQDIQSNLASLAANNPNLSPLQPLVSNLGALDAQLGNFISALVADGQASNTAGLVYAALPAQLLSDLQNLLTGLSALNAQVMGVVSGNGTSSSTSNTCTSTGVVNGLVNGLICGLNGLGTNLNGGNLLGGIGALLGL
jgi:hypothetical protein